MIVNWLAGVALAGIDVNGVGAYPDLPAALAVAVDGDVLTFDGATYTGGVVIDSISLTFEGNGSTLEATSGSEIVRLINGGTLTGSDLVFSSTVARGLDLGPATSVDLTDVTFRTAVANGNGGGIQANDVDSVTLTRVVFDGTSAGGSSLGKGGGLSVNIAAYPVVLSDVSFLGTFASRQGGGLWAQNSSVSCDRCTFDNTEAVADGGAVWAGGTGDLVLTNSTFTTSTAGSGGAIRTAVPLTLTNSVLCDTSTTGSGGAVYSTAGGGTLANNVFVDGSATDGGAMRLSTGTWVVQWNHVLSASASRAVFLDGATTTANHNLFLANSGTGLYRTGGTLTDAYNAYFGNTTTVVGGASTTDLVVDPELTSFVDDGDCTNDLLWPRFGSPLVDAGDPLLQDPDGSTADIGAFGGPGADPAPHDDADNDGYSFLRECDDFDAFTYPFATERCDELDNDCDDDIDEDESQWATWFEDCDGDTQGATSTAYDGCFPPSDTCTWVPSTTPESRGDCDDSDATVFLGADEYCRAGDQDCDGVGATTELGAVDGIEFFVDADGDGYGNSLQVVLACANQSGVAAVGGDCNDGDAAIKPGAVDVCGDGADTDCSGVDGTEAEALEQYPDVDLDGFGDSTPLPVIDCVALDGYVLDNSDCNDALATSYPGATETCDGDDNDCDGIPDNTTDPVVAYYRDVDGDDFGDAATRQESSCGAPEGFVAIPGDCDEQDVEVNPDAIEVCNDRDDDCDLAVDLDDDSISDAVVGFEDIDLDGFGTCGDVACEGTLLCGYGDVGGTMFVDNHIDCNDAAPDVNPNEPEVEGNTVDENCDGDLGPATPTPRPEDPGCNCNLSDAPSSSVGVGLLALLLLRRRR